MKFIDIHPLVINLTGNRVGRWTVLGPTRHVTFPAGAVHIYWLCRCECSSEKEVNGQSLRKKLSLSCGCLQKESAHRRGKSNVTHGQTNKTEWRAWGSMRSRCFNPRHKQYPNYGGRGITVCQRWLKFENFLADMGKKPSGFSLDRIDNNGNYEPNNCRWTTSMVQNQNNRGNRIITAFGKTGPISSFFDFGSRGAYESQYNRCVARIAIGWDTERAITAPPYSRRYG